MRTAVICALLAGVAAGWASEAEDRAGIERVITLLNNAQGDTERESRLFTAEAQNDVGRLAELDSRLSPDWDEPLSEVSRPRLVVQLIRFVSADVAMVDVADVQFSSMAVRKVPALFVMKRQREGWRIASVRLLAPAGESR
jgi:hypothetical protein